MAQLSTGDSNSSKEMREMMEKLRKELQASEEARRRQEMDMARLQSELAKAKQQLGCKVSVEPEPTSVIIESCFEEDSKPPDMSVVSNELEISEVEVVEDFPVEVKIEEIVIDDDIQEEPYQVASCLSDLYQDLLIMNENGERSYACLRCNKLFTEESHWEVHVNNHNSADYSEEQSTEPENSSQLQSEHSDTETSANQETETVYKVSGKRSKSNSKYKRKSLITTAGRGDSTTEVKKSSRATYMCSICGHIMHSRYEFTLHENGHLGLKLFPCDICGKSFIRPSHLKKHKKNVHFKLNIIQCEVCGKIYSNMDALKQHLATHTDAKTFECEICGKMYSRKRTLEDHLTTHEPIPSEKSFACKLCGKRLSCKRMLQFHELNHRTGSYKCMTCGKGFKDPITRAEHTQAQHGPDSAGEKERKHVCSTCGKGFLSKGALVTHQALHRPREHACPFCHKTFSYKGHVKEHVRIHTGEKPYVCDICPKSFTFFNSLRTHKMAHKQLKPYVCKVCGKSFGYPQHLKRHKLFVHKDFQEFFCSNCDASFMNSNDLEEHEATHQEQAET